MIYNWDGTQTAQTLTCRNAGGAQRMPDKQNFMCVIQTIPLGWGGDMSYQEKTGCLCANSHPGSYTTQDAFSNMLITEEKTMEEQKRKYIVRRLTPKECGRLQGFPDYWTEGVPGSDSAQYKMWGNGMALPCVLYVMQGIRDVMKD